MTLIDRVKSLLGISAYQMLTPGSGLSLDAPEVQAMRRHMGGQIQPLPISQTRWYLSDLENAELLADRGDISQAARLMRAARKDGIYSGVLSTRCDGLVRLPKKFRGNADVIAALEIGHEETSGNVRSVFDEIFPPRELALLAADGEELGIGVGELVPVVGRDYPVFVRLSPEFLRFVWSENRWYFRSTAGPLPITPGDGRWILHVPGGRISPWQNGLWRAIGQAFIRKTHAALHRDNWEGKLANPARVAVAPQGASDEHKQSWFRAVMAWGINTVFGMTPGYDVKLLESNGRGWECFNKTIAEQNQEFIIAVTGQTVTTDGGAGFSNADIHKSIRADLIEATGDSLAYTINTQGIPAFVANRWGTDAVLKMGTVMRWDVTPPKDRASEANSLQTTANAIKQLTEALAIHGRTLDINALCSRFGVPVQGDSNGDGKPDDQQTLSLVREAA